MLHFQLVFMNILTKTESAAFYMYYCRFSLFLKDPYFRLLRYSMFQHFLDKSSNYNVHEISNDLFSDLIEEPNEIKRFT